MGTGKECGAYVWHAEGHRLSHHTSGLRHHTYASLKPSQCCQYWARRTCGLIQYKAAFCFPLISLLWVWYPALGPLPNRIQKYPFAVCAKNINLQVMPQGHSNLPRFQFVAMVGKLIYPNCKLGMGLIMNELPANTGSCQIPCDTSRCSAQGMFYIPIFPKSSDPWSVGRE